MQREKTAREAEAEERRWKESEIARGDELQQELNRVSTMDGRASFCIELSALQLRVEVEELRRERTRCDALQALIDSLEIALSDERTRLEAANSRVSQLQLQVDNLQSEVA